MSLAPRALVACAHRRSPDTLRNMSRELRERWRELVRVAEETYLPYARKLLVHLGPDSETEARAMIGTALVIQAHLQSLLWETAPGSPIEDAWEDPMDYQHVFHQLLRQLAREGRRTRPEVSGVPDNAPADTRSTPDGVRRSFDLVRNLRSSATSERLSDFFRRYAEVLADFCEDKPFAGLNDLDRSSGRTDYMCTHLPALMDEPGKFNQFKEKLDNYGSLMTIPGERSKQS